MAENNRNQNNTLFQIVRDLAAAQPDASAIRYKDRKDVRYADLLTVMTNIGRSLYAVGFNKHSRIAIVTPNGPEMALAILSIMGCSSCAPLNPKYTEAEFHYYLDDLNISAVVVLAGKPSPVRAAAARLQIPLIELVPDKGGDNRAITLHLPGGAVVADGQLDISTLPTPDDTALILHTSGTTSRPKIVPLSQNNVCQSAANICTTLQLTKQDCCFNIMPLFHIHGIMAGLLSPVASGGSLIASPGFADDPFFVTKFFPWLEALQPSWYTAVPTMHQAILANAKKHLSIVNATHLRFIRSSSASLAPPVMAELEETFKVPVVEAYGMTEAAHQMACNPLPPAARKPRSVGMAAGPEVAIMDAQGNSLPAGETGEIVIKGPNVMTAYENNTAANQQAFFGAWFRTGDEGYFDNDQYLFITGRLKEQINRGGEKISPREIDEIIIEHPAVNQAVVFAAPHPTLGEIPAAAVVLNEGHTVTEAALREYIATQVAAFKVPNPIIFVDEIPKGPSGKLQRIGLSDKLLQTVDVE